MYKSGVSSNAQTFKSTHIEAISENGTHATIGTCGHMQESNGRYKSGHKDGHM